MSNTYDHIGDVQMAQGDLPAALSSFQSEFTIMDRLAKSDPDNAAWENDLMVSYMKIGVAYRKLKQPTKAREAFAAGRVVVARCVTQFPNQAQWKDALAWLDQQIAGLKN